MEPLIAAICAGILVFVAAFVQHLNTVGIRGLSFVLSDRSASLSEEGFAGRARRTLQNNLESAAMMVPLALASAISGGDQLGSLATGIYVVARIGFTLSYWLGIYLLRSAFWGMGMLAIGLMAISAIRQLFG